MTQALRLRGTASPRSPTAIPPSTGAVSKLSAQLSAPLLTLAPDGAAGNITSSPPPMLYVLVAYASSFPWSQSCPVGLCPMLASQLTCEVENSAELAPDMVAFCSWPQPHIQ